MVRHAPGSVQLESLQRQGSGFALVDVIVATILLGVSLTVLISLSGRAVTSQTKGQELATAARLADEQLQLLVARGPDDYARRFPVRGQCEPPFGQFGYELALSAGGSSEPYRASVTITWSTRSTPQSIRIETLVASRQGNEDFQADPDRKPPTTILREPSDQ